VSATARPDRRGSGRLGGDPLRQGVLWVLVAAALAAGVASDVVFGATTVGLTALTGLGGCVLLIVGSKALGKHLLQRPEDYYPQLRARTVGSDPTDRRGPVVPMAETVPTEASAEPDRSGEAPGD
jgi:hypothetical protein